MGQLNCRTKHELKSEATRAALLKAAEVIFARDGYERAQIDDIAEKSGRTRGAVYAQFKTKEQLFFALHEQLFENAAQEFARFSSELEESGHGTRLAALRQHFSKVDDAWGSLLDLEMKLYAIRHAESASEWREHYLRFHARPAFAKEFGIQRAPGTSLIETRVLALTAIKGSLLLTHLFLPDQVTTRETTRLLQEIFEALFPESPAAEQNSKPERSSRRGKPKTTPAKRAKSS